MNNPFDPVVGASTTTCSGFTDMMRIYERGICTACKVSVAVIVAINSAPSYVYVEFVPQRRNATWTPPPDGNFTENNAYNTRYKLLSAPGFNEVYPKYISHYCTTRSLARVAKLDPASYSFTGTTGPAFLHYVNVGMCTVVTTGVGSCGLTCRMKLTYYCKLFDKQQNLA